MIIPQSELRKFLSKQNYSGDDPQVIKLAQLIRNDGLYAAYSYLEDKSGIYKVLKKFVRDMYDDGFYSCFKKRGISSLQYMELSLNIVHLAIEWTYYKPRGSKKIEEVEKKKRTTDNPKIDIKSVIPKDVEDSQNRIYEYYRKQNYEVLSVNAEGLGKMVIGIGDASVTETSMTLHPFYQQPYIPSTALKGVFHHYCLSIRGELDKKYKDWEKDWFGSNSSKCEGSSKVIYMDTYFTSGRLVGDVITPHFKSYYGTKGKVFAKDDDDPRPINFKAVKDHVCNFRILLKPEWEHKEIFKEYFRGCFPYISFGAKGTNGYGSFKVVE